MPPDKKGRKSSILKPPKVRNPLSDLDFKPSSDDDGITSEFTRSRRVSFSSKKGVALFTSDEGNTVWHNIYEEANKPDVSDSSSIAASNHTNVSSAPNIYNEIQIHENESISFDGAGNHDITFAAFPCEDDDFCDNADDILKSPDRPTHEISQPTFVDQTDALINYEINFESTATKIISLKTVSGKPDSMSLKHDRSVLFNKNDAGKPLTYSAPLNIFTNNTNASINKENIDRKSRLCLMEDDIQNSETVPLRKRFTSSFDQYQQDCRNLNKIKTLSVPMAPRHSNLHDITDINQSESVSEPTNKSSVENLSIISIIEESKRVHKIKQTIGGCPLASFDASLTMPLVSQNDKQKRQTIIFDQKDSEGNMSITGVIPPITNKTDKRKTIVFNQELPDSNMSITGMIPPVVNENDYKRRTVEIDEEAPDFNMSMTGMIPPVIDKADLKRRTILFNEEMPDGNMSMTSVIPPIINMVNEKRKTIVYNEEMPDSNMSMTNVIPGIINKGNEKRKTILFNQEMPDCNMSLTSVIPPILNKGDKKRKTIIYNEEMPDSNMSMTNVIPGIISKGNEKRKTIVFNPEMPDCNMSLTSVIPPILNKADEKRKTIIYNEETPDSNMSMTSVILGIIDKGNEKRKTIVFNQEMPDCNMSLTSVIPPIINKADEKRKTIIYNEETLDSNMSMTSVIPGMIDKGNEKRKTIVFNQEIPDCNMSLTSVIPPILNKADEKRKTIIYNEEMPDSNMSMTSVIPGMIDKGNEKRKTIVFNQEMPDCNMSLTSVIPPIINKGDEKRKTIVYNEKMSDNMSMTSVLPRIIDKDNEKRKTIVFNQEMPDCNMSMTSVIPGIIDKANEKRKTIIFNESMPDCNMSMTGMIPPALQKNVQKRKTIVFSEEMPDSNMSMTSVILPIIDKSEHKRRTIIFDRETADCDMSITSIIVPIADSKIPERKTIFSDQEMQDCNMSMTTIIPSIAEITDSERRTIVFNQEMPDCNMSIACVIPPLVDKIDQRRKTILSNEETQGCNMSSVIPSIVDSANEKRKTIVFDQEMPDFNMSITCTIPPVKEKSKPKRKTILFDQEMPNCNMSMTEIIPPVVEKIDQKRKTIIFNQEITDCNMSMTGMIPPIVDRVDEKRKTIIFNKETPDCEMTMTSIIPVSDKSKPKRKTILFDQKMPNCNMSMTKMISPVIDKIDQKRKTIIFNQEVPDSSMSIIAAVPSVINTNDPNENKTVINKETQDHKISMNVVTSPMLDEIVQKRKTILFNQEILDCNLSMTNVIPPIVDRVDEKRKTIVFDHGMPDFNMSRTDNISQVIDIIDVKRKTILFDQQISASNMLMGATISQKTKKSLSNDGIRNSEIKITNPLNTESEQDKMTHEPSFDRSIADLPVSPVNDHGGAKVDYELLHYDSSHVNAPESNVNVKRNVSLQCKNIHHQADSKKIDIEYEIASDDIISNVSVSVHIGNSIKNDNALLGFERDPVDVFKDGRKSIKNGNVTRFDSTLEMVERSKISEDFNEPTNAFHESRSYSPMEVDVTPLSEELNTTKPPLIAEMNFPHLNNLSISDNINFGVHIDSYEKFLPKGKQESLESGKPFIFDQHNESTECLTGTEIQMNVNENYLKNEKSETIKNFEQLLFDNLDVSLPGEFRDLVDADKSVAKLERVSIYQSSNEECTNVLMMESNRVLNMHCQSVRNYTDETMMDSTRNPERLLIDKFDQVHQKEFRGQQLVDIDKSVGKLGVSIYQTSNEESTNVLKMESSNVLKMHNQSARNDTDLSKSIRNPEPSLMDNLNLSRPEESRERFVDSDKCVAKLCASIHQTSNEECTNALMMESSRVLKMQDQSVMNLTDGKLSKSIRNPEPLLFENLHPSHSEQFLGQFVDIDKSVSKLGVSIYQTSNKELTNAQTMESSQALIMQDLSKENNLNIEKSQIKCQENVIDLKMNDDYKKISRLSSNDDKEDTVNMSIDIYNNDIISEVGSSLSTDTFKTCTINENLNSPSAIENVQEIMSDISSYAVRASRSNLNTSNSVRQHSLNAVIDNSHTFTKSNKQAQKNDRFFNKSYATSLKMDISINVLPRNESAIDPTSKKSIKNTVNITNPHDAIENLDPSENNSLENLNVSDKEQTHLHSDRNKTFTNNFNQSIDTEILADKMDSKYGCTKEEKHQSISLLTYIDDNQTNFNNFETDSVESIKQMSKCVLDASTSDRIEDKSVDIYEKPNETREKRKSDNGNDYESSVKKKIKTSTPACAWLSELKNESLVESSVCNKDANISAKNIKETHKESIYNGTIYDIDTTTYVFAKTNATLLPESFDKPQMDVTAGKPNMTVRDLSMDISDNKNIKCDSIEFTLENCHKSTDDFVENISDLSLVNISMDKSDDNQHEEIENKEGLRILPMDSPKQLSVSGKSLNLSGSICHSMYTMIDSDDSRNTSIVMPFEPPPNLVSIIDQIGLNLEDCVPENLDGKEWTFRLLWSAIRLIVKFGPSVPENRNLEQVVSSIALEPISKEKPLNIADMFHPHAVKLTLHQLKSEELTSLCQISGDLPNLLRHCAQVSSAARKWSSDLYSLYVNYGLQYLDDRFSFRIANGIVRCIWQVDVKTHLLPFTDSENISIRVLHGSSPIQETSFKSAANKIRPNWAYIKNLALCLHSVVKDFCDRHADLTLLTESVK